MELIRARRVTLQICILYKPEKSVILLSANLGLERQWIRGKTRGYLLHRALRRQIFQQKWKVMYKIYNNLTPDAMSAIIKNNDNIKRYQLRKKLKIDVPRFNTNYMRNSVEEQ